LHPLREFHRDPFGSDQKDEFAIMKLHDLVSYLNTPCAQSLDLGLDIIHRKADMVEP
jgi:hypothetical protein